MIFVTVGEQLPFDRLIRAVDNWVSDSGHKVFAQTGRSDWKPAHIQYEKFLSPEEYMEKFLSADIIVAHAGMGTIISALESRKPIIVMPRQAALGEHRNDHQFATARRFLALNYVSVAFDQDDLLKKLEKLDEIVLGHNNKKDRGPTPLLIKTLKDFIQAA